MKNFFILLWVVLVFCSKSVNAANVCTGVMVNSGKTLTGADVREALLRFLPPERHNSSTLRDLQAMMQRNGCS
jgi:hypothetical protein